MAMVEARNLTKIFRDFWGRSRVRAVDGLSFTVRSGEAFGLLGPNGSGKSTTLKMLLGLLRPTRGALRVLGRSPRDVRAKARIGYLPEESYLYPFLTPEETLNFYGKLFGLSARERRNRTDELLEMVGLAHARRRPVGDFSKGMARRIGLAQALINDPDLLILDEPTSGLDPLGCRQMKDLLRALTARGKTILLTSHLLADVEDVCDRVAILYNGRPCAEGAIADLLVERRRVRITLPADNPAVVERVLAAAREALGAEPETDHPRKDLEAYFLEVIARARAATRETTGAAGDGALARYLAAPAAATSPSSTPAGTAAAAEGVSPAAAPTGDPNERLRRLLAPDPPSSPK